MRAQEFIVEYKKYPTQEYGGVTFTMMEKDGQLIVKALNDFGIAMGYVVFNIDGRELDPKDLEVEEKYQGQGIASTMYDYIKSQGWTINRSFDQTDAGRGFWDKHRGEDSYVWEDRGQGAAGIVLYAKDTGRYGLQQRSNTINDPGLWAAWGGGREPGETLEQCAIRELAEEGGYTGPIKLKRLAENSKYVTFIGIVPHEFKPRADDEWQDYCWVEAGDWPAPMHPGVTAALKNIPKENKTIYEDEDEYKIHNIPKLDRVLARCCRMVIKGQRRDPNRYGQVAACVIDPDNRMIYGINLPGPDGTRRHAERVAIEKYKRDIGDIPPGSIIVTTCSPCNSHMDERYGESCKDLLNSVGIHKVYAGYQDPTQHDDSDADFNTYVTKNDDLWEKCQLFAQTFLGKEELPENFADGKNPGRKGLSKRVGVDTKASVSSLRKTAKHSTGEKARMAHWLANMKSGRAKAKRGK